MGRHDGRQFGPSAPITSEKNNELPPLIPPFEILIGMGPLARRLVGKRRLHGEIETRNETVGFKRKGEGLLERRERERKRKNPTRMICIHGQPAARCESVLSTRG